MLKKYTKISKNVSGDKSWIAHFAAGCPQRSWVVAKHFFDIILYTKRFETILGTRATYWGQISSGGSQALHTTRQQSAPSTALFRCQTL